MLIQLWRSHQIFQQGANYNSCDSADSRSIFKFVLFYTHSIYLNKDANLVA